MYLRYSKPFKKPKSKKLVKGVKGLPVQPVSE